MAKEELKVGNRVITEFENFAKKVAIKVPQQPNSYRNRFGRSYSSIPSDGYSKEDIRQILESGDPGSIRELSRYFSRFCGTYARPPLFLCFKYCLSASVIGMSFHLL